MQTLSELVWSKSRHCKQSGEFPSGECISIYLNNASNTVMVDRMNFKL